MWLFFGITVLLVVRCQPHATDVYIRCANWGEWSDERDGLRGGAVNVWFGEMWQAWRASMRRPSFLLLSAGVLALGIGSSAAAFSLLDNAMLKPLPFAHGRQLVALERSFGTVTSDVSPQQFQQMQPLTGVASMGLLLNTTQRVDVGGGKPALADQTWIGPGLLRALGVHMTLGRAFDMQEYASHAPPAVLLSHGFWLRRYGGSRSVVGNQVLVDGSARTVVGVLPADFRELTTADIIRPLATDMMAKVGNNQYIVLARLDGSRTPAAVAAQATARLRAAAARGTNPTGQQKAMAGLRIGALNPRSVLANTRENAAVIVSLETCGLLVLLIALVNLVNLMVMHAATSAHSQAVRESLGATGLRLALPVLAEGLLVGLLGSVGGMALGWLGIDLLQHFVPLHGLTEADFNMGANVWLLAVGVGVVVSLLAAWLGQYHAQRTVPMEELREGARGGESVRAGRLGRALVVTQLVFAMMGLMATAMMAHAVVETATAPPGFNPSHMLVFKTKPLATRHAGTAGTTQLATRFRAKLRAVPGVEDATIATHLPIGLSNAFFQFTQADGSAIDAQVRGIDAAFFRTFRIPLLAGRNFTHADLTRKAKVAIINRQLAMHRFHGKAVGRILGSGTDATRVIGVVRNAGESGRRPQNQVYIPRTQYPKALERKGTWSVAVRVHGAPNAYRRALEAAVSQAAPLMPIADMRSMHEAVRDSTANSRNNLLLMAILAGMSLLLAAAGQYAVMMSAVIARKREFSVRMALGASPGRVSRWVVSFGMRRIILGLLIGVALGVAICLMIRRLLVLLGSSPIDPWAIGAACIVLGVSGLLACVVPALRASRVQPMQALRGE